CRLFCVHNTSTSEIYTLSLHDALPIYATDVISFPNDEDPESFGDIFINLEKAFEQAAEYGHSYEREVGFLAVHGYLHLKGYDHHTPEEEKEMFTLQEEILQKANLKRG